MALDDGLVVTVVRDDEARALQAIQTELNTLVEEGPRRSAWAGSRQRLDLYHDQPGRLRRRGVHPDRQPAGGRAPSAWACTAKLPAVIDDALTIREQMTLSLAFDHRVADGAPAARFLQRLKEILEYADIFFDLTLTGCGAGRVS